MLGGVILVMYMCVTIASDVSSIVSDARLPVAVEVGMPATVRLGRCYTSLRYCRGSWGYVWLFCVVQVQSVTWADMVGSPCDR